MSGLGERELPAGQMGGSGVDADLGQCRAWSTSRRPEPLRWRGRPMRDEKTACSPRPHCSQTPGALALAKWTVATPAREAHIEDPISEHCNTEAVVAGESQSAVAQGRLGPGLDVMPGPKLSFNTQLRTDDRAAARRALGKSGAYCGVAPGSARGSCIGRRARTFGVPQRTPPLTGVPHRWSDDDPCQFHWMRTASRSLSPAVSDGAQVGGTLSIGAILRRGALRSVCNLLPWGASS